jgi:hypothetical protein
MRVQLVGWGTREIEQMATTSFLVERGRHARGSWGARAPTDPVRSAAETESKRFLDVWSKLFFTLFLRFRCLKMPENGFRCEQQTSKWRERIYLPLIFHQTRHMRSLRWALISDTWLIACPYFWGVVDDLVNRLMKRNMTRRGGWCLHLPV